MSFDLGDTHTIPFLDFQEVDHVQVAQERKKAGRLIVSVLLHVHVCMLQSPEILVSRTARPVRKDPQLA